MKKIVLLFFWLSLTLLIFQKAEAQKSNQGIRIGLKLPYSYDFGYSQRVSPRFGYHFGAQFITIPFAKYPINAMNFWGADPEITAILEYPFTLGTGLDIGAQYHFGTDSRRYYFSLSYQWMTLLRKDIEDEVINEAFDIDITNSGKYPLGPISKSQSTKPLTISSNYSNLGIAFGKIIPLQSHDRELKIEIALAKTLFSHFRLQSDYRYLSTVSDMTNDALQKTFWKYGWFPTINVYYLFIKG